MVVSLPAKGSSDKAAKVITSSFLPIDLGDVVLQAESPSGNKLLILRSVSNGKGKKKFVEVRIIIIVVAVVKKNIYINIHLYMYI